MNTVPTPSAPTSSSHAPAASLPGVILLGGAHNALAQARSFGRRGIQVIVVTNDHPLPKFSRYVRQRFDWPGPDSNSDWLLQLARSKGWQNWLLLPCGDGEVRFVAENLPSLREVFHIISSEWSALEKLCDKHLLAQTAVNAGVEQPKNYLITSADDIATMQVTYPVILKPAMRMQSNRFTSAKVWQADTRDDLVEKFQQASKLQNQDGVVVQELIPGGGEAQLSYAAFWRNNLPIVEMTVRRTRQYPVDFGTATFVEVVHNDEVIELGRRLLGSVGFEGLVEMEFKFDRRSRTYKVIDVNTRPWGWEALCANSGPDFCGFLLNEFIPEAPPAQLSADLYHAWIHSPRDVLAAISLIAAGRLTVREWLQSYRQKLTTAVFAWDDPVPAIVEIPVSLTRAFKRLFRGINSGTTKIAEPHAPARKP